jgi:hypothetical protein
MNTTLLPFIVKAGNNKYADNLSRGPCQEVRTHCHNVELRAELKQLRAISALLASDWDPLVLIKEQITDRDIGSILQEVESGRRPEGKDIADRIPTYKSYWAQLKSLAV